MRLSEYTSDFSDRACGLTVARRCGLNFCPRASIHQLGASSSARSIGVVLMILSSLTNTKTGPPLVRVTWRVVPSFIFVPDFHEADWIALMSPPNQSRATSLPTCVILKFFRASMTKAKSVLGASSFRAVDTSMKTISASASSVRFQVRDLALVEADLSRKAVVAQPQADRPVADGKMFAHIREQARRDPNGARQ